MAQHDKFGREVKVGDPVLIKGSLAQVLDDPNYLNCTVKLAEPLPPSGAESDIRFNTAQLELDQPPED